MEARQKEFMLNIIDNQLNIIILLALNSEKEDTVKWEH